MSINQMDKQQQGINANNKQHASISNLDLINQLESESKQLKDIDDLKYIGKRKRKSYFERIRDLPRSVQDIKDKKQIMI